MKARLIAGTAVVAVLTALAPPAVAAATTYTVLNTGDAGADTLRQAVLDANAHPGADTIEFAIASEPNNTVQTIALTTGVIVITEAVTIDGYTQANATPNTLAIGDNAKILVQLSGASDSTSDGIQISAGSGGVTIKGLAFSLFSIGNARSGLVLSGTQNNLIAGNIFGSGPSDNLAVGNGRGITVSGSNSNTVGGGDVADRNIISGNSVGIDFTNSSDNNVVKGNYIGTTFSGIDAKGKQEECGSSTRAMGRSSAARVRVRAI